MIKPGGSDITEAPGWKRADPEVRAQIAEACLPYLEGFSPSEEWLDPTRAITRPWRAIERCATSTTTIPRL